MKKSLFALAALGAFAGAASAQSSVTVYGVVDVGYVNQKATGAAANTAGTVAPSGQQNSSMFGNSMEQTSRLG
ncbi:MAG: porin, partial [Polynucleobacter sp.]|nr:porin [Polynucleobacter sp.]